MASKYLGFWITLQDGRYVAIKDGVRHASAPTSAGLRRLLREYVKPAGSKEET